MGWVSSSVPSGHMIFSATGDGTAFFMTLPAGSFSSGAPVMKRQRPGGVSREPVR